jgi:hypothetical protein
LIKVELDMVIGKILYLSHSAKLIRVGINTTIEDVYQHTNNLSVFLFSLLTTLAEPIIKIRIVVVEIKLEVIRFILIFFAKVFKIMVKGAMRTEGVYGTLPSVGGRTIKITVQRSEGEVPIKISDVVTKMPGIRVRGRPQSHEFIRGRLRGG